MPKKQKGPARAGSSLKGKLAGRKPKPGAKDAAAGSSMVSVWEDDPGDPKTQPTNIPISVPLPNPSAAPLPFKISTPVTSIGADKPGTPSFRYWATAAALRRTADFWGPLIKVTSWKVGKVLSVILDDGVDLNAFYTRGDFQDAAGLHFFHDTVSGRTYYSSESPDVACHEMGHAVLDAFRPQLFNAHTIETSAFHESFGDMSAILSALQVPSFRSAVLQETDGTLNRSSRLSRLAEQLGAAIRIQHPDAADPDCLRNAANSFFYRDPQTLPPAAPASQLSSEPHSFSRVFTAAFLDALAGMVMVRSKNNPTSDDLLAVSQVAAETLVEGVSSAAIVPDFFSQVAAAVVAAANNIDKDTFRSAFVRRGILSLTAASSITRRRATAARLAAPVLSEGDELPQLTISGDGYGLKKASLRVHVASEPKYFGVTGSSLTTGPLESRSAHSAAEAFTEDLFQTGRVETKGFSDPDAGILHPMTTKTHAIVEERGELVIKRKTFACGFD
jgi:hypothetical protein